MVKVRNWRTDPSRDQLRHSYLLALLREGHLIYVGRQGVPSGPYVARQIVATVRAVRLQAGSGESEEAYRKLARHDAELTITSLRKGHLWKGDALRGGRHLVAVTSADGSAVNATVTAVAP